MKDNSRSRNFWASLLLLAPILAVADDPSGPNRGPPGRCDMGMHGFAHPPGSPGGPLQGGPLQGGPLPGDPGSGGGAPPFMMGVALTEDQRDKVFAIMHSAAPALREREKAARKAREALHQLVRSPSFSDSSAAALAQTQGTAESQLALLRTKMEHDVYAVLTPEQQSKITSREKECEVPGHGGPPPGGWQPR